MTDIPDGFPESEIPEHSIVEIADQFSNVVNLIYRQQPFNNYCGPLLTNAAFQKSLQRSCAIEP